MSAIDFRRTFVHTDAATGQKHVLWSGLHRAEDRLPVRVWKEEIWEKADLSGERRLLAVNYWWRDREQVYDSLELCLASALQPIEPNEP